MLIEKEENLLLEPIYGTEQIGPIKCFRRRFEDKRDY